MLGYVVHDRASEIIAVVGWFLFVLIVGLSGRVEMVEMGVVLLWTFFLLHCCWVLWWL